MTGRPRAVLELLRAPLLLSPVADTLTGAAVACAGGAGWAAPLGDASLSLHLLPADAVRLLASACVGCCLLAAGMTLNGLVDLPSDRVVKPGRPLPRGALSRRFALCFYIALTSSALIGGFLLAQRAVSPAALITISAIVLVTGLYHAGAKHVRILGCLLLGAARGLDLLLGAVVFTGGACPSGALLAGGLYAAYMCGASLHASSDDETTGRSWSPIGLGLSVAALAATALPLAAGRLQGGDSTAWLAAALALLAVARLSRAWARLPPPAVTGVALSGLYLMLATLALSLAPPGARLPAAGAVLVLFGLSRLLFRAFPPT